MSSTDVARHFNVTTSTVYNWVARGLPYKEEIRGTKKIKRFDLAEVEKWVKNNIK